MGKAKSSQNKDDKKNKKALKNKSEKENINAQKKLKSLKADQQRTTASVNTPVKKPAKKSLNALKNIQQRLDKLVSQREAEKQQLEALQRETTRLSHKTTTLKQQNHQFEHRVETVESQQKQHETQLEKNHFQIKKNRSRLKKSTEGIEKSLSLSALNSDLLRIKYSLEKKNDLLVQDTEKLASEIAHFKALNQRVEQKILSLENKSTPPPESVQTLNENNDVLYKKIADFEEELKEYSDTFNNSEQNNDEFNEQLKQLNITITALNENQQNHDTQIKLLQTDTSNIRKSLQQETQNFQQQSVHHQENIDVIKHTMSEIEDKVAEQALFNKNLESTDDKFAPLESQIQAIENQLEIVQQEQQQKQQHEQQTSLKESVQQNEQKSAELALQISTEILESQASFKTQFQKTISKQLDEQLDKQLNEKLLKPQESLKQQLEETSNKSINLENLVSEMQVQQNTDQAHHDELSKQYLLQQQQLDKHDVQLSQLDPLIAQNEITEQQLEQISAALEQFSDTQNNLTALENELQSGFLSLDQKIEAAQAQEQTDIQQLAQQQQGLERYQQELDTRQQSVESHHHDLGQEQDKLAQQQLNLENRQEDIKNHQLHVENHQQKMVSYQQDQGVEINQLSETIKTRSKWFAIALVSTFTLSTLLILNQEFITQTFELESDEISASNKEALISEIKTAITNETYTKINALTKQNSAIINEQLNQVRDSIEQVSLQTEQLKSERLNKQTSTASSNIKPVNEQQVSEEMTKLQSELNKTQNQQLDLSKNVDSLNDNVSALSSDIRQVKVQLQDSIKQQQTFSSQVTASLANIASEAQKSKVALTDTGTSTDNMTLGHIKNTKIDIIKLDVNATSFYTVQLLGATKKESIKDFIQHYDLSKSSQIYQVEWHNKPWYILVQGHFSSFSKAKASLETLPDYLSNNQPWIKKLP
ncbi:hypothetical protein [sulfur-oxidizing endosymbiont of Gigantopelta aegis]|uniref:hypothetical protein n=1 Tax=sulfur-oxidizing endosymbiont of Gigantopelta aegis TaxID=2794934 RepID=UPI0018DBC02D|nr:hypothetical protein [sulfur-oxidizing endosymbiont of Gigantopelta aegis]